MRTVRSREKRSQLLEWSEYMVFLSTELSAKASLHQSATNTDTETLRDDSVPSYITFQRPSTERGTVLTEAIETESIVHSSSSETTAF